MEYAADAIMQNHWYSIPLEKENQLGHKVHNFRKLMHQHKGPETFLHNSPKVPGFIGLRTGLNSLIMHRCTTSMVGHCRN